MWGNVRVFNDGNNMIDKDPFTKEDVKLIKKQFKLGKKKKELTVKDLYKDDRKREKSGKKTTRPSSK